jgi:hypothetical protein
VYTSYRQTIYIQYTYAYDKGVVAVGICFWTDSPHPSASSFQPPSPSASGVWVGSPLLKVGGNSVRLRKLVFSSLTLVAFNPGCALEAPGKDVVTTPIETHCSTSFCHSNVYRLYTLSRECLDPRVQKLQLFVLVYHNLLK